MVRPWIVGSNDLEPIGSSITDGITGRIADPVTGAGLFNPNTDPNVVGIDPITGVEAPSGTDIGFSSWARGRIDRGLYNADLAIPPPDPDAPINSDPSDAGYNPLPGWRLVNVSGSSVTATWEDGAVTFALGEGAAGDDGAIEQLHAVNRSLYQRWTYAITGYVSASVEASANAYMEGQFLDADLATTGSAVRAEGDSGAFTVVMGATPTDAVYLRVRMGIERDALAVTGTASRTWTEATVHAAPDRLYLSNRTGALASIAGDGVGGYFKLYPDTTGSQHIELDTEPHMDSPVRVTNTAGDLIGAVPVGLAPFAYPLGLDSFATSSGSLALDTVAAGVGGARAIPIHVPALMLVESLSIWSTDTGSARTAEWALYWDGGDASSSTFIGYDAFLSGVLGTFSFTPGGSASVRTSTATGAPLRLAPGIWWLVIRNTSTARTFGLGYQAAGDLAVARHRFDAAAAALSVSLDISGWSDSNAMPLVRLNGRIGAEAAEFI